MTPKPPELIPIDEVKQTLRRAVYPGATAPQKQEGASIVHKALAILVDAVCLNKDWFTVQLRSFGIPSFWAHIIAKVLSRLCVRAF